MKKTCPTCPFLECNRGKPNPTGFKCEAVNETEWYSQQNINEVWNVMRKNPIMFLSCHTSDPDYFGREGEKVYACVGAALLAYMHIKIYEAESNGGRYQKSNYNRYVKVVGERVAMDYSVMGEKLMAFVIGRTSIFFGGMALPHTLLLDLSTMRWPDGFEKTVRRVKQIIKMQHAAVL